MPSSAHRPTRFAFVAAALALFVVVAAVCVDGAQRAGRSSRRLQQVCGDPTLPCAIGDAFFQPYDLPFRVPKNAVIWETEPFYAVVLKSARVEEYNCESFIPEAERFEAQQLFPRRKVFASRCAEAGSMFYTNVSPGARFMAVYAGQTRAEAARTLARVRATGRFPDAYLRLMRAGFNGT